VSLLSDDGNAHYAKVGRGISAFSAIAEAPDF
jgi:hypothetical protein